MLKHILTLFHIFNPSIKTRLDRIYLKTLKKALIISRYLQFRVEHALDEGCLLVDLLRVPHKLELLDHLKLSV